MSTPNVGLELTTPRSRVTCSTHWAREGPLILCIFLKFYFIPERQRQSDRVWARKGQRERVTQSKAGSRLWAVSTEPHVGLKLRNQPWDHDVSWSWTFNWLWHSRSPPVIFNKSWNQMVLFLQLRFFFKGVHYFEFTWISELPCQFYRNVHWDFDCVCFEIVD